MAFVACSVCATCLPNVESEAAASRRAAGAARESSHDVEQYRKQAVNIHDMFISAKNRVQYWVEFVDLSRTTYGFEVFGKTTKVFT